MKAVLRRNDGSVIALRSIPAFVKVKPNRESTSRETFTSFIDPLQPIC